MSDLLFAGKTDLGAEALTYQYDYDASSNLIYLGAARSVQPSVTLTVASVSKANPAVFAVTAHGLVTGQTVTIASASGSWTTFNGNQTVTVIDANSFSIAINSTGYTGSFDGVTTTTVPQTGAACWQLTKFVYNASNLMTQKYFPKGLATATFAWDSRTTYSYQ